MSGTEFQALRRRRWTAGAPSPVAYPAWRYWEDWRVRFDDAVTSMLVAVRLGRHAVRERAGDRTERLVSELFSDEELPFRQQFKVPARDANRRWDDGQAEFARMTMVLSVAGLDDLLGDTIAMLRQTGIDRSDPDRSDTGVASKLSHLARHCELKIDAGETRLHELCVSLRNAITHHGATQRAVAVAWNRLHTEDRAWWEDRAGRQLPLAAEDDAILALDDHEQIGMLEACDRIAVAVNGALRERISDEDWIRLVFDEYRHVAPHRAGDRTNRVPRLVGFARMWWRLSFTADQVREVVP